jgi:starvation-inducible DNA-binding protein
MRTILKNEIFDEKTTALLAEQLQPCLTDLLALGLMIKQAHWNVQGPHFRSIHLQLDEIWDTVQESADEIAERISTLAVSPSGQAEEIGKDSSLSQIPLGFLKDDDVIDLMTDRIGQTCRSIRERLAKVEDPDVVTADMIHEILEKMEKHLWMMRSQGV